ncbi:hypothetical protein U1Q18_027874 [Sarracenia purpurea var. burkii]
MADLPTSGLNPWSGLWGHALNQVCRLVGLPISGRDPWWLLMWNSQVGISRFTSIFGIMKKMVCANNWLLSWLRAGANVLDGGRRESEESTTRSRPNRSWEIAIRQIAS